MKIRDLSDLELCGLLAYLVVVLAPAASSGFGPVVYSAMVSALNETEARGRGAHDEAETLFNAALTVSLADRRDLGAFIGGLCSDLGRLGFHRAAGLVRSAASSEIKTEVPAEVNHLHGRELRLH